MPRFPLDPPPSPFPPPPFPGGLGQRGQAQDPAAAVPGAHAAAHGADDRHGAAPQAPAPQGAEGSGSRPGFKTNGIPFSHFSWDWDWVLTHGHVAVVVKTVLGSHFGW